ncbi:unnamed protein product [Staurois parvus]|uniref:Uncharacterized protein n=1 Tax=Staurois parvus TaxID=386267 RepID=A0ABN9C3H3_9NEOB|nr:unnamed protein product [Staurois parvus]
MLQKKHNNIKKLNKNINAFWLRFMKKDYLFTKFYKKNTFFSKCLDFFIYIAKKKNTSGEYIPPK